MIIIIIILEHGSPSVPGPWLRFEHMCEREEEEEEDLFVFNDTIEGPRAPAVKPGRITHTKSQSH